MICVPRRVFNIFHVNWTPVIAIINSLIYHTAALNILMGPTQKQVHEVPTPVPLKIAFGVACALSVFPGSARCLNAFTIALGQASERKWYTSTLELQLASFEVCVACRGVRTLLVTVDEYIPLSLWDDHDSFCDPLKRPEKRRLPARRAAAVAWKMPAGMLVPVLSEAALLRGATRMQLTGVDYGQLDFEVAALSRWDDLIFQPVTRLVHSPRSYFEAMLTFLDEDETPINTIQTKSRLSWPSTLRQLSLGCLTNELVNWVALPRFLERLALGGRFDQPIESVAWPVSLMYLTLGGLFNQCIADVIWLSSLLLLTFGDNFDQPITDVAWPDSLLQLTFGDSFDQPIADVAWPTSLLQLSFGDTFDQPIADVVWPASLLMLAFVESFDQPIADVTWPNSLTLIFFGRSFDQPIDEVVWPASLSRLEFGEQFNHPITEVSWPTALQSLAFGHDFDQTIEGVKWPASLRRLTFSENLLP